MPQVKIRLVAIALLALIVASLPATSVAASSPKDLNCSGLVASGTYRNVIVKPGHWCALLYTTITGNIVATRPRSFEMALTSVHGNVTVTGTTSYPDKDGMPAFGTANVICSSVIGGNVTITGSGKNAPWDLSSSNYPTVALNISTCLSQISVGGSVVFNDNHGTPNAVGGASIKGNLTCLRNGPFTSGVVLPFMKNGVHGRVHGQCKPYSMHGNNPAILPGPPMWLKP